MNVAESLINKSLYKIELLLIKSIPFVLALICFVNTTLSFLNIDLSVLSYIGGVSLLPLLFLYISSFVFKFCIYHRLPIYYITVNWILNIIDLHINIHLNDRILYSLYLIITFIFITIAIYGHYKRRTNKAIKKDS